MKSQRDYYQDWLARLRKELAISGRKTELVLFIKQQIHLSESSAKNLIDGILSDDHKADLDLVLEIDQWRANKKDLFPMSKQQELDLED